MSRALAPFSIDSVATQTGLDVAVLKALADELAAATGRALVVAGGSADASASGPALELAALLLNVTLGAFEAGLFDEGLAPGVVPGGPDAIASLASDMLAGKVDLLLVAANPVYDAPSSVNVAEALGKVPYVVSLNDRVDETAMLADVLAPVSHPFECWGDAVLPKGSSPFSSPSSSRCSTRAACSTCWSSGAPRLAIPQPLPR